jgi:Chlorophyll A-B binding protein
VEIKHGRIAMLAVVGHIATTAGLRLPGNENIPTGLKALTAIPTEQLLINLAVAGALDVLVFADKGKGEYPGDLRNGLFKWSASPEEQLQKRAIELNNGRAAMMGILGLMYHETMTGEPYMINAFLGYPSHFNEGF